MGRMQQSKGKAGELELCEIFHSYGFTECKRGDSMTFGEVPDISGLQGIHVEVKRVEHLNVLEAMKQSIRDSKRFKDGLPCLFHRKNRSPWLVTMTLEDWLQIYKGANL